MIHRQRRLMLGLLPALFALLAAPSPAFAAEDGDFPQRSIELVVPWQAGGGADVVARAFSSAVAKHLPQPVVVVNKPGASGAIGIGDVIRAQPDGYRLVLATSELVILRHLGMAKFSYTDLAPVAGLNSDPAAIVVRADDPARTLEDFLAKARAQPGVLSIGNAGVGSTWHMAAAAFAAASGTRYNEIPFPGGAPALLALLGGHIDAVSVSTAEASTYVDAGKLRILAVMADKRERGFESVPTLKELGIDVSVEMWRGLAAPKNTPASVMAVLRVAAAKAVKEPAWLDTLAKLRFRTDSYADAATLEAVMAKEDVFYGKLAGRLDVNN
ncbi:tripartite tricarboxylate transporter substrate binding protein [Pollutimonas bauzanensis]|uniref:Tripartite-type tricarboxylate transporter, receptor component TctC n=1 Tax=Pollutimonas bauzanensis TaxID=658167 RepID=A0A1M5UUP7_9BURK|nr:tripartite tricarboxylate transporter substrate binding protein [Pollutimonas bauzanensis]SHH66674.1 Tripartite-type tricarboxylate transporter, receptor component TctC [Pollutimonas bauzanensis]